MNKPKSEFKHKPLPLGTGPRGLATVKVGLDGSLEPTVTAWSQEFFVDQPYIRSFVVAATDVFMMVQNEGKSFYPDPVPQKIITSLSRMYRGFLLELCQSLKNSGDMESADLYSNLDFVWNFCEVMFLSSHPDFPILPYLSDWIKLNFDLTSDILPKFVDELPNLSPESRDNLWTLIYSHTFHGATEEAARLLDYVKNLSKENSHSVVLNRQIGLLKELLIKRPEFNPDSGSVTEFQHLFKAWQEECENRLENGAFVGNENFIFLCKILCGNSAAFQEAVSQKRLNWYEYMVLILNYKYPTVRPSLLKVYAMNTLEEFGLLDKLESRDMILLHAMEFNIVNVMKELQNVWDNPWFALHFCDLVYACGKMSSEDDNVDYSHVDPLRNHFILDYGATVMEHPTLWQMGIYYLQAVPEVMGKPVIRECLRRRNPDSEIEAQKILQIAEKFGFGDIVQGVCRQICLQKLKWNQQQNALLWAIKAGDGSLTTRIVDSILFDGDCEIESSLLDSLRNIIPSGPNGLMFLGIFCEFRTCVTAKNYKEAVKHLCSLVHSNLIPRRIAHKILLKNQEIFEDGDHFEPGQISILMEFLHTKISRDRMNVKEFTSLNEKMMRVSTYEILSKFRNSRRNKDMMEY